MYRRALLRASDQDREHVAQRLHAASLEGRLTSDELDERLGVAYAALTYGELDEVIADLPPATLPATRTASSLARGARSGPPLAKLAGGAAFIAVFAALAALARVSGQVWGHASRAAGGSVIPHAFGLYAVARATMLAVVGLTFLLVLVAAIGWAMSRPRAPRGIY